MQDFVERNQDVAFDVLTALGESRTPVAVSPRSTELASGAAATAKELLEEIAEARAVEMELRTVPGAPADSTLRRRCLPSRTVPIRA